VAIVFNCDSDKIPRELVRLVRVGIESGAALSGTVQTENIGFEKIICNIVANPNIRYMVIGGPESEGHRVGEALEALLVSGVDKKKRIIGASAPHPILHNVPMEMIERFCKQVSPINVQFESDPDLIRKAVWSCYQEVPVEFRGYQLYDSGAYPEPAMNGEITWRVTSPFGSPLEEGEEAARERARAMGLRRETRIAS